MRARFREWLLNTSIRKKFIPLQAFIITLVVLVGLLSILSLSTVNYVNTRILEENVQNREHLSDIVRTMSDCRVLGRDILLEDNTIERAVLYHTYTETFSELDDKMDAFTLRLEGEKLAEFESIIEEKNKYKDSMILSAQIRMDGGDFDSALDALTSVTPIATEFFGSIDAFLAEEEAAMDLAVRRNESVMLLVLLVVVVVNVLVVISLLYFIKSFSNTMSTSLVTLEGSVSQIAETGDMKIEIPKNLCTKDEIGHIASAVVKLKKMLLHHSFTDALTGGYNAKAYHSEVLDIFEKDPHTQKEFWCVVSDMNNLKVINDVLGHLEGDAALRKSYAVLKRFLGPFGKTFRVGGDEFVSVLFECTKEELEKRLHDIDENIRNLNTHPSCRFSLAWGFDKFCGHTKEEYEAFFQKVDKQMYDNKKAQKLARLNARVVDEIDLKANATPAKDRP